MIQRPDWKSIYSDTAYTPDNRANDLVPVTRETLRCAHSALQRINAEDYYHNNGAAQDEIARVLAK